MFFFVCVLHSFVQITTKRRGRRKKNTFLKAVSQNVICKRKTKQNKNLQRKHTRQQQRKNARKRIKNRKSN